MLSQNNKDSIGCFLYNTMCCCEDIAVIDNRATTPWLRVFPLPLPHQCSLPRMGKCICCTILICRAYNPSFR
uniref:Uncharacterized protein n=1 Tax=Lepeophtheirus salmonis TaxID=72036 RepID=A0A0K2U6L8_LEPSM